MDANGSNERRVFQAGHVLPFGQGVGSGEPVVSPDGRKVVLARRGLTVTSLATGASKRIGDGEASSAAWSPDGNSVVFSGRGNKGLYTVDLRGGRKRTLLRKSLTWSAAWSPDDNWIAFSRQIGYGPVELYAVHPDGSGLRRLTGYAPEARLAWSRNGRLAFIGTRGDEELAHLVVVDTRAHRVDVMPPRLGGGGTVAWSPDGRTIAYAATTRRSEASAIYTVDADGGRRVRLTPLQPRYSDAPPIWSPDGKSLLFERAPIGGGAEREISEVWTMRSDGSHQRPLTKAYPDGGDNVEPSWIRGAVHAEPAPRPQEVRRAEAVILRVPFALDGISAEGVHAVIAPVAYEEQRDTQPTPPILVWRPGHGRPKHVIASPCGGVQQLVLARSRLAFDCNQTFLDLITQSLWVVDLRTRVPREVFFGHGGPTPEGLYLDHVVGGGGLLAFGSERRDARGIAHRRTLWRIDRFDSIGLRSGPRAPNVVAAGGGRLAAELANGRVAILRTDGAPVRVLPVTRHRSVLVAPFGIEPKPPFLLAGRNLLLLEGGALRAYDTATGNVRWDRRVPAGAQLEDADGHLVIYTAGSSVHILSRGSEKVLRTGAGPIRRLRYHVDRLVHGALTADGLYYCFNVADHRYPGRVVFVPRRALLRGLR
jgi:hypothetical protein